MLVTRGGGLIWKSEIWVIQIWITPLFGGGLFSKLEIWIIQIWITPLFRGGLFKYFWHSSFKYHLNHINHQCFCALLINFFLTNLKWPFKRKGKKFVKWIHLYTKSFFGWIKIFRKSDKIGSNMYTYFQTSQI